MTLSHQGYTERKTARSIRSFSITDLNDCEQLWKYYLRRDCISDLWEFRLCFHKYFGYRPYFLILEDREGIAGILPLSFIEETDMAVFFPGEMWEGKTWFERTPIYLRDFKFFNDLIDACPYRTLLRYIDPGQEITCSELNQDEIGYVLYPKDVNYDLTLFRQRFSNKKFKAILKVVENYKAMGCTFHLNRLQDFDTLVDLSILQFGHRSYLTDPRFREGFRDAMHFLQRKNLLRMVSIEIDGRIGAVDLGAYYQGVYTVFLGGANPDFPGIAKLINMYHITTSFNEKYYKVDFLCGDFHWKKLWHLDPEPLYKFVSPSMVSEAVGMENRISGSLTPSYLPT